jgi:hypothetical protein
MSVGTLRSRETRKEKPMASKQMNWRFLPVLAALAACVPPPVAAQTVVKIGVVNNFSGFSLRARATRYRRASIFMPKMNLYLSNVADESKLAEFVIK